jgi:DNA-binding response OmpR family regulator
MQPQILIIENDLEMARAIEMELICEGYQVTVIQDGMEGLLTVRRSSPNLLVLGWELTSVACLDICQRLRSTHSSLPILVLTKKDQVRDRIASLEAGADSCLTRPFNLEEFVATVRALLRRGQQKNSEVLEFKNLVLDRGAREVHHNSQEIKLTAKEFDLLEYLMTHAKRVLSREQILQNVWGYDFLGDSNIIEVYIRYLRLKLETHQTNRLIHTVRGVGYVLRS